MTSQDPRSDELRSMLESAEALAHTVGLPDDAKYDLLTAVFGEPLPVPARPPATDPVSRFGELVRQLRLAKHLSYLSVAKASGLDPVLVAKIEEGRSSPRVLTPSIVGALSKVLGDELLAYRPANQSRAWFEAGAWLRSGRSAIRHMAEFWAPPTATGSGGTLGAAMRGRRGAASREFRLPSGGGQIRVQVDSVRSSVTVRLRDERNRPLAGWEVELLGVESSGATKTDQNGIAVIDHVSDLGAAWVNVREPAAADL